jgi:hypothetical protein
MKEWVEVTYPGIVELAVKEDSEIWWLDETVARNSSNYIRGCAPKGVTPILPISPYSFTSYTPRKRGIRNEYDFGNNK